MDNINDLIKYYQMLNKQNNSNDFGVYFSLDKNNDFVSMKFNSNIEKEKYINTEFNNNEYSSFDTNIKNPEKLNIKISHIGLCWSNRINMLYNLFFSNKFLKISQGVNLSNTAQQHIHNLLLSKPSDKILNELKHDSNNIINDYTFQNNIKELDIVIIMMDLYTVFLDYPCTYSKIKHKNTGLELYARYYPEFESSNKDRFEFYKHDKIMSKDSFRNYIKSLLNKYSTKKFIFINIYYAHGPGGLSQKSNNFLNEYNSVLDEFKNYKNFFLLDNRKIKFNNKTFMTSDGPRWWSTPFIEFYTIVNALHDLIKKMLISENKSVFISESFNDVIDMTNKNFFIKYINESKKPYITTVIKTNELLNEKINKSGLFWTFTNRFLRTLVNFKVSDIENRRSKDYEELYNKCSNKNYKLKFYARVNKYNKNFKFNIFNGKEWILIDKEVTEQYSLFEINTVFNFSLLENKAPKIGFINTEPNNYIFLYRPEINVL